VALIRSTVGRDALPSFWLPCSDRPEALFSAGGLLGKFGVGVLFPSRRLVFKSSRRPDPVAVGQLGFLLRFTKGAEPPDVLSDFFWGCHRASY